MDEQAGYAAETYAPSKLYLKDFECRKKAATSGLRAVVLALEKYENTVKALERAKAVERKIRTKQVRRHTFALQDTQRWTCTTTHTLGA